MKKRFLSILLLATFVWTFAEPALATAFEPVDAVDHHADGIPCSDGDGDGPCDDNCPCLCCPGHLKVVNLLSTNLLDIHLDSTNQRFSPSEENHPNGIHLRIFRPPRF
jgi:hypothetical protein